MARYVVQARYGARGPDGSPLGPWASGVEVDLDDAVAAWVNRDSDGVLRPEPEPEPEPSPAPASDLDGADDPAPPPPPPAEGDDDADRRGRAQYATRPHRPGRDRGR